MAREPEARRRLRRQWPQWLRECAALCARPRDRRARHYCAHAGVRVRAGVRPATSLRTAVSLVPRGPDGRQTPARSPAAQTHYTDRAAGAGDETGAGVHSEVRC